MLNNLQKTMFKLLQITSLTFLQILSIVFFIIKKKNHNLLNINEHKNFINNIYLSKLSFFLSSHLNLLLFYFKIKLLFLILIINQLIFLITIFTTTKYC